MRWGWTRKGALLSEVRASWKKKHWIVGERATRLKGTAESSGRSAGPQRCDGSGDKVDGYSYKAKLTTGYLLIEAMAGVSSLPAKPHEWVTCHPAG